MRRLAFAAVGLLVLATAGLAVAKALEPTRSITPVTGTFPAMTVQAMGSHRCTISDGKTLVTARARYSGVAAGDGTLPGQSRLMRGSSRTRPTASVWSTASSAQVATGGETGARFTEVGRSASLSDSRGPTGEPHAKLFANFSSGFVPATGFTGGKIGATDGGSAVEVGPGKCAPKPPLPQARSRSTSRLPGREAEARTGRPGCEEGSRPARRKGQEGLDEAESARNGSAAGSRDGRSGHVATRG